jgi:hypothetical protein
MKRSVLVIALLPFLVDSPAYAGKYACNFQKDGNLLKQCSIDSSGANQTCEYVFSSDLKGICGASADGKTDFLRLWKRQRLDGRLTA